MARREAGPVYKSEDDNLKETEMLQWLVNMYIDWYESFAGFISFGMEA